MRPAVRTRRATPVVLPPSGAARQCRRVPLSPLDTLWVVLPPVTQVFLFPAAAEVVFSDVVRALSSSLAALLPAFHLLAGEVTYAPELGTVTIDCGEDAGVAFVEAETDLDFTRLVADLDDEDALQLVPDIRREELPAPVLAVQVTEFVGGSGGIALGVAFNHVAMDGIGFLRFMRMWAASAVAAGASSSSDGSGSVVPLHDRRLLRFDGDEELAGKFLRQMAPDLPRGGQASIIQWWGSTGPPDWGSGARITKHMEAVESSWRQPESQCEIDDALRSLKQRLTAGRPEFAGAAAPSTFATLVVHGWVCLALASGFTDAAPVFAAFLADCRAYMSPPVPDAYLGNCVASCVVPLSRAELTGADGPALAFLAIRDTVMKVKQDPLADSSSWLTKLGAIPPGRMLVMAGSPWFPAYAVDFGFGRPSKMERAPLNDDGVMAVCAGREAGSVQVSVAIAAEKMPAFHKMFACS